MKRMGRTEFVPAPNKGIRMKELIGTKFAGGIVHEAMVHCCKPILVIRLSLLSYLFKVLSRK